MKTHPADTDSSTPPTSEIKAVWKSWYYHYLLEPEPMISAV